DVTTTADFNLVEKVDPTPTATGTGATPTTTATATATATPATPGFGAFVALAGLGAVALLVLRRN
ncbi:MAG: PGF-CTERM sorting domain-containing protein, partial [Methanocalculaceae archaeon]|nr:PGF-CTERM sorting domain-containing protein [Methanocalculaceae archaeon]